VTYEVNGSAWKLSIADNGMGKSTEASGVAKPGLGTSIVNALAHQLDARVDVGSSQSGTTVTVMHGTLPSVLPRAG
jgi:two-component sensor histidine kinase